MLEQTVVSEIGKGKRNFSINLTNVDYLYSDSINKFINLNHQVLNVYGRLALLSPSAQVSQILQRAGIQNFLKIYTTEDELKRASDEIIQQTTALNINDIKAYTKQEAAPLSEYEDFRSEIGRALDSTHQKQDEGIKNFAQADSAFADQSPFALDIEETGHPDFTLQPPSATGEVPFNPNFAPAPSQSNFSYPTMPPPPPPPQFDYSQMPSMPNFDSPPASPPQFAAPYYPDFVQQAPTPPEFEQSQAPRGTPRNVEEPRMARVPKKPPEKIMDEDRFMDDDFDGKKKKFSVAAVLIPLILLLIIGGGIAYFVLYNPFKETGMKKTAVVQQPTTTATIPQIAVTEEPKPVEEVVQETPPEPEPEPEPVSRPTPRPTPRPSTRPSPRPSTPAPKAASKPIESNKLIFTSSPANAIVSVNGNVIGNTPYTWTQPNVYGMINIVIEKNGYTSEKINLEFTGGTLKKHFVLKEKVEEPNEEPKPAVVAKPAPSRPEPTLEPSRPEPAPEPVKPVAATPPSPPPPASSPASSGGAEGAIFISSLPPMADVYMNGVKIGKTNIAELKVTAGTHEMKFVKADKELTKTMTFTEGKNPSQLIRLK